MDFRRMIENGTYNEEMLNKEQKQFVNGMRKALEDAECCVENIEDDLDTVLGNLVNEIRQETLRKIKTWVEGSIAEAIVCLADGNVD